MSDTDQGGLALERHVLDALQLRAKVAMHNIANQNTPGFKRYYVTFEEQLREAHAAGADESQVEARVLRDTSGAPGLNNVFVVDEQAVLEKVRLLNDIFTRRAGSYFSRMNRAIFGR